MPHLHDTGLITPDHFLHWMGGVSYMAWRQSGVTPLHFGGVKPLRSGGEVQINLIHSAPHSISCDRTSLMWSHFSWDSQLPKTIDLDTAVLVDSVASFTRYRFHLISDCHPQSSKKLVCLFDTVFISYRNGALSTWHHVHFISDWPPVSTRTR